jgi:hypothetical protein
MLTYKSQRERPYRGHTEDLALVAVFHGFDDEVQA